MLDIKFIEENIEMVKKCVKNKNAKVDIDALLELDEKRKKAQLELDTLKAEKNALSKDITGAPSEEVKKKASDLKTKIQKVEELYKDAHAEFYAMLYTVPNVSDPSVPVGKDENENVEVKIVGEKPNFDLEVPSSSLFI